MKVLINESKLKDLINKKSNINLSDLKLITNVDDLPHNFTLDSPTKKRVNKLLNINGPMTLIQFKTVSFIFQDLGKGDIFLIDNVYNHDWREEEVLDLMNLRSFGIGLKDIIDLFYEQEN